MEIPNRRTDPWLERYGLECVGASGNGVRYQLHEHGETIPATIEIANFNTYRVNNEYSVLYVPTTEGSYDARNEQVKGFELRIQAHPFSYGDGQCIIMPTQGFSSNGLTDKCVCLGCLRKALCDAKKKTENVVTEVLKELSKPVRYKSITDKYRVEAKPLKY